jgi:hypothetical protein
VYEWSDGSWTQLGGDIDGEAQNDSSGGSVALSADGTILAVGAEHNDGAGANAGHARVYEWSGGSWTQLVRDVDGETADDRAGFSVALSANGAKLAVGAYLNDGSGSDAGHARVYELVGRIPSPAPTPFYSHAGVTNTYAVVPHSDIAGWNGWDPAHDWSFSFKAYRGTWSQGSFFAFANDVTTPYSATSASHWHRSASLDIAGSNYYMYWASDSVDHRMKPMAVTSDTYVEMLFAYDSSAYAAGTSTAPDQGAGFKWYMRTASSSGALASASWSEVTTTHGADQFDRADAVTWPQNPNMALGIEKGGYRPFNSDTRQGSVTEVRLWSETLTPATLPPYA